MSNKANVFKWGIISIVTLILILLLGSVTYMVFNMNTKTSDAINKITETATAIEGYAKDLKDVAQEMKLMNQQDEEQFNKESSKRELSYESLRKKYNISNNRSNGSTGLHTEN